MKRLTISEISAIIGHAEAMQAERRGLQISLDVAPLRYYGVGIGFVIARRDGYDSEQANVRLFSADTLEDLGFTTVQEIIDLITDTANEVMA